MQNLKKDLILIYGPGPVAAAIKAHKEHGQEAMEKISGPALECYEFLYPAPAPEPKPKKTKPAPAPKPTKPAPQNKAPKDPEPEPEPVIIEDPEPEPEPAKSKTEEIYFSHERKKTNLFKTDIYLCCGNDDLRPQFQRVVFIKGYAIATDGHILCKQSLKYIHHFTDDMIKQIEGRQLMSQDYKKLCGLGYFVNMDDAGVWYLDKTGSKSFVSWAGYEKFPEVDAVIPDIEEIAPVSSIGMDPALIDRLWRAMARELKGLKFMFFGAGKPILANDESLAAEIQTGLIMPTILNK